MNSIVKFFHQLLNPHCEHCKLEEEIKIEESKYCKTCEVLQMQLAAANQQSNRFAERLFEANKPNETTVPDNETRQVIQTRRVPWSVIKNKLETESKLKAEELRQEAIAKMRAGKPDNIEMLEKDLGISDAGNSESLDTKAAL